MPVILTDDIEAEQARILENAKQREYRHKHGLCETCGVDLATNIDRGILLCAWSHREQFEQYQTRTNNVGE